MRRWNVTTECYACRRDGAIKSVGASSTRQSDGADQADYQKERTSETIASNSCQIRDATDKKVVAAEL